MKSNKKIVLDIGSMYISFYTDSFFLRERNLAVVRRGHGLELLSCGWDALTMMKALPEHSYVVKPLDSGAITNPEALHLILKSFFSKYFKKNIIDKSQIYCLIPCGLSIAERESIEKIIAKTGYKDITLVESIIGLLPYTNGQSTAVAILGASLSEIGVIDNSGIISGLSINLGGDSINTKIKEIILEKYSLKIGWATAEKIKINLGSLYENDKSLYEIVGQDILDQQYRKIDVSAESIRPAILHAYKRYVDIIESTLTTIPNKSLGEVSLNGLMLAGGGAEMRGVIDYFAKYLNLPIKILDRPEIAHLKGMSILVNDKTRKYEEILGDKR